jgi:hypothetical protein
LQGTDIVYSLNQERATDGKLTGSKALNEIATAEQLSVVTPKHAVLSSERYMSDAHFSKDATFFHILRNSDPTNSLEVYTQDFFIDSLRPYMHELIIHQRSFADKKAVTVLPKSSYSAKVKYIRVDEGTAENVVTISGLEIPPLSEVVITFGVSKSLREWEKYPNDPSRGFNIMHMPVYYRTSKHWQKIESAPLLV